MMMVMWGAGGQGLAVPVQGVPELCQQGERGKVQGEERSGSIQASCTAPNTILASI
jgi:hypothetical protein